MNNAGGSDGVIILPKTQEELQEQCIHVWRDGITTPEMIHQECIRCKKERNISII